MKKSFAGVVGLAMGYCFFPLGWAADIAQNVGADTQTRGHVSKGFVQVALPKSLSNSFADLYDKTRGEADCCGVSAVYVYKLMGADPSKVVKEVLKDASKTNEDVGLVFTQWSQERDVFSVGYEDLGDFLFSVFGSFSRERGFGIEKEMAVFLGGSKIRTVYKADIEPAPSVDGNVEVGVTEDGEFMVVLVTDFGA